MPSQAEEPSILIVGAGVIGASTAYHLSLKYKNASRITVIDRTLPSPDPAASTDINKIIRADYSNALYAELAYEAMDAWSNWPELKDFYHRTGWIMLDEEGSDLSSRIRSIFKERGHDPTRDIPVNELDSHWKGILKDTYLHGFNKAYFNPEAGWCNASAATASIMNSAISRGVNYIVGELDEVLLDFDKVIGIKTKDGTSISADKIVLATGAWTSSNLSPIEDILSTPAADRMEQQAKAAGVAVVHYRMSDSEMEELHEMPVVVYSEYGEVIPPPKENHLLKYTNANTFTHNITTKSGYQISVPPSSRGQDQRLVPEILKREMYENMTRKVMPNFAKREPDYWRICWDSITPTQDWLLCKHPHPKLSNLFLAVGGSFHSYKFLPIIGKYMLNVLSGEGNGEEKDAAWRWKDTGDGKGKRGAHESTMPRRDLGEIVG